MKKQLLVLLFVLCCLSACASQPLQLHVIDALPASADKLVTNEPVQLITHGDETYVVVHSTAEVEATFDIVDGTLQLHFHMRRDDGKERTYFYELVRGDAQYERVEVYVAQQRML